MILIGNGEKRGEKAACDSRLGEQVEKTRERAKQDRLKEMPSAYRPFTHSLLRQALIKPCLCARVRCEHLLVVNQTEKVSPFTLSHGGGCKQMLACVLGDSVVSSFLQPHGLQPARLLCPWHFPGRNTGAGCHFLVQGIFLTPDMG